MQIRGHKQANHNTRQKDGAETDSANENNKRQQTVKRERKQRPLCSASKLFFIPFI